MAAIGHFEKIRALCGNARLLVTGGTRAGTASQVVVFDHVAGKVRHTLALPAHVLALALDGEQILCACADGTLRGFDAETGKETRSTAAHTGPCAAVVVSGERIYTAGADGRVRWFRRDGEFTGTGAGTWQVSPQPLRALAVDAAGETVAAAGDSGVVHVLSGLRDAGATDVSGAARRDMPGHDGAVNALVFTPRDGRLISGGEDGTLRLWYTVGAIESETRTTEGQAAAIRALLLPPAPAETGDGEPSDRVFAAAADGKVRVFRLEDRRKPRTLECGSKAVHALCFLPAAPSAQRRTIGTVAAGGDGRTVYTVQLDTTGAPADKLGTLEHGFDTLAAAVGSAKPAREAAYRQLASLDELEALELLLRQLGSEREPDLRTLIVSELGQRGRKPARLRLRQMLDDAAPQVRRAALRALRSIEGPASLSPLRAALAGRHPDTRQEALTALLALRDSSPLVPGLLTGSLVDADAAVRLTAFESVLGLFPAGSSEPLRLSFERGPADVRTESLIRGAALGLLRTPELAPVLARALDDEDAGVRRTAFALAVLLHPRLGALLEQRDEDFARTLKEIDRHEVLRLRARRAAAEKTEAGEKSEKSDKPDKGDKKEIVTEAELAAARAALTAALRDADAGAPGGALTETDLQPLLIAMACRTASTALRGARGLALLGDTRALGALLQLSREEAAELRRDAAKALRALSDPRARRRLIWMLDDADAGVRGAALDAYAELCAGPGQTLEAAEAALRSSHEDIRVRGLDKLVGLTASKRTAAAETLLGHALEDESAKVRAEALRTLWSWHEREPMAVLDRALAARFPDLRLRAVEELARLGKEGWALDRLKRVIADRDAGVAQAAYEAVVKLRGKEDAEAHLLAIASTHRGLRELSARGAGSSMSQDGTRAALVKLLDDEAADVRIAAVETLNRRLPKDPGPLYTALQGPHLDLRVRAAELLAARRDERLIEPMRALLQDKDLERRYPPDVLRTLRLHAAMALATLGAPSTVRYLATELIKDEAPDIREQAARGLATAARPGDEGYLLDLLGHADIWVRSWAADGLSRLGDSRALPVLTGTLRHDHLPIRWSALISFAALGPEGYGGMLQGLEDPSREVQEMVFAIVLARDLLAFRRGQAPDLLASALSSQRAEVRFAAARALELRTDPETFLSHVLTVLSPPKPDKAQDMKSWPEEEVRAHALLGLAEALASDRPDTRYAAAQILRLRRTPLEYFREAQRLARPRAMSATVVPDTAPRAVSADPSEDEAGITRRGWLRRLFHGDTADGHKPAEHHVVPESERAHLLRLSFGAYVGLLRQQSGGDDERVRRDAVDRIVELGSGETIGLAAALPSVVRALDDGHYLVRKAAFAGLRKLFPAGSDEPLRLALRASAADVARAALDEFAGRGERGAGPIAAALSSPLAEVRRYAFELLERLSPPGSLEPLLLALQSEYADLRIGVLERLTTQSDARVTAALKRAMTSDHDDLRLRAAELLAERKDDQAVDVLAALLRAEDAGVVGRAQQALLRLGSEAAVHALAARLERDEDEAGAQIAARTRIVEVLGQTGHPAAVPPLAACLADESAELRQAAFDAALTLSQRHAALTAPAAGRTTPPLPFGGPDGDADRVRRDEALLLSSLRAAAQAKDPAIRLRAARELGELGHAAASPAQSAPAAEVNELLGTLIADRDAEVRATAVAGYRQRVIDADAPLEPLLAVLRGGARELMLPAAEGAAARGNPAALRPLLLFVRAGEENERPRALLALGSLGDTRALAELEKVAAGGTKEAPVEPDMQAAAIEALGRIAGRLTDPEARQRAAERVEEASESATDDDVRQAAVRGLRWLGGERTRARLESILLDGPARGAVQVEAARQLGHLGDVAAEQALAKALNHWDDDVRAEARRALDRLFAGERTRVEFLAVDSDQEDISDPAATYLATAGEPALLLQRLGTLKDDDLRQRLRYGLLRRPQLPGAGLVKLFTQEDAGAREAAAWLLGARAGQGLELDAATVAALAAAERRTGERWAASADDNHREGEEHAWVRLLWALHNAVPAGTVESAGVRARARELLRVGQGSQPGQAGGRTIPKSVRQQAVRGLAQAGEARDAELFTALLGDPDPGVREAAAAALGRVAPAQAFAAAAAVRPFDAVSLAPAAQQVDAAQLHSSEGRRLGLPRLIRGREAAPLTTLLRSGDRPAQLDAIAALGRTGGADALAALHAVAFDKQGADEALRKSAYRAYRRARRKSDQKKRYEAQP